MYHIKINEKLVEEMINSAAWDEFGVKVAPLNEETKEVVEDKDNPEDYLKGKKKEKKGDSDQAVIDGEVNEEAKPTCPMCKSELEEELSDEHILECVTKICDVLDEISEEVEEGVEDTEDEKSSDFIQTA